MKSGYIILLAALACTSFAGHNRVAVKIYGNCEITKDKTHDNYVTIWVHGLKLFGTYKRGLGLHRSSEFKRRNSLTRVMEALQASYDDPFSREHVYGFIWSAEFSLKGREKAAADLNMAIEKLAEQYHFGKPGAPKLRVVGFSEGVNVVLSLAKYKHPGAYEVDELILLAGPVQYSTAYLVHDDLFHHVFNLYSTGDYVQLIDIQKIYDLDCTHPILTTRRFCDAPNLIQIKARTNGHAMGHFGFNSQKFVVMLAPMIDQLNQWLSEKQKYDAQCLRDYIITVYPCDRMALLKCNGRIKNHCKDRDSHSEL